jgi:hypothetical protein
VRLRMWSEITWSWLRTTELRLNWSRTSMHKITQQSSIVPGTRWMEGSSLLLILSRNVIREYHFSQIGFFHFEMGEELESEVIDQPCARGHICDQVARSLNQNLSCICLFNTHYTWMPPLICTMCHF